MQAIATNPVAGKVRAIAAERRVNQALLADALDVSRMAIVRRYNGSVPFADHELITLGRFFDVPVGYFFGEVAS